MSQPLEIITGWEIQPYVPKVSDNFHQEEDGALHAKLYKLLRQTVRKSVSKLKSISPSENSNASNEIVEAVPLSFKVPEVGYVDTMRLEMLIAKAQRQKKQRTRTSLVGEICVSFKLPEDFVMSGVDTNKIAMPQDRHKTSTTNYKNGCQFSLSERLEGWKVERRQRSNGRYDLYYRHEKSKALFRSTIEVVNFLLYEGHSDKHRPPSNRKSEENSPVEKRNNTKKSSSVKGNVNSRREGQSVDIECCENTRSSIKKNWSNLNLGISPWKTKEKMRKSFSSQGREVEKVETVEELISDNIANINNNNNNVLHSTSISQSDDDRNEKYCTEYSSESTDDEEITPQMVEQFLESAYINLLNYFNKEVEVPKVMSPKNNKRKRSEARGSPPAKAVASCIKIEEEDNLNQVVNNIPVIPTVEIVKVEADPTADVVANADVNTGAADVGAAVEVNGSSVHEVEANRGRSLAVLSSYNDQCDLINHIPWADMFHLIARDNNRSNNGDH